MIGARLWGCVTSSGTRTAEEHHGWLRLQRSESALDDSNSALQGSCSAAGFSGVAQPNVRQK